MPEWQGRIEEMFYFFVSYYENSFNCWQNKIPLSLTKLITIIFCSIRREIGIYFYECNRFRMSVFFNLTFYMQHVGKSVSEHCEIELDLNFNCTFPVDLSSNGILFVSRSVVQVFAVHILLFNKAMFRHPFSMCVHNEENRLKPIKTKSILEF